LRYNGLTGNDLHGVSYGAAAIGNGYRVNP